MIRYCIAVVLLIALFSCRQGFYTEGDFPSVNKADAHMHLSTGNGFFEEQAEKDNFILLTINVDVADTSAIEIQYKAATESVARHPGKVFYSTTFNFDTTGWGSEAWSDRVIAYIKSHSAMNPVSVKIWKNIGMTVRDRSGKFIMADDPGLDKVFSYIKSTGLPVTGHLGEPRNCWLPLDKMTVTGDSSYFAENPRYHMYLHPDFPSYEQQIEARDHLLDKNPDMVFIGCHLGSLEYDVDELAKRLDKYPNMAVDLSARICHLQYQAKTDYDKIRNFCIKYQDRLLYGTDLSDRDSDNRESLMKRVHQVWLDDWKFFVTDSKMTTWSFRGEFMGLHLPKDVVDKIFYKNAVKWYRLKV
ncbi:MAG: amidohydrolase family protein [Bacteroidales bacterium]